MTQTRTATDLTVANTIQLQLGGRRFSMMTGAKDYVGGDNFLQFSIPLSRGINKVRIELDSDDTYTVKFYHYNRREFSCDLVSEDSGVYSDNLQAVFTSATGLYTTMR